MTGRRSYWGLNTALLATTLILGSVPSRALAYEFSTHAMLTREAFVRSVLSTDATMFDRFGVAEKKDHLSKIYLHLASAGPQVRASRPKDNPTFAFEKLNDANRTSVSIQARLESIAGWLMQGAIREDDVIAEAGADDNTPQDDPEKNFNRVFNHFFNPYTNSPILFNGIPFGEPAPAWALVGTSSSNPNRFALPYAREAMWRALTLTTIDSSGGPVALIEPSGLASYVSPAYITEAHRDAYWATTFRALGDVVHLLQDMAQPQHTRSDNHAGAACVASTCLAGHASYYENYVEARTTGRQTFNLKERVYGGLVVANEAQALRLKPLALYDYPVPDFATFDEYFSSGTNAGSLTAKGLANFSNQAFYSIGTNLGTADGARLPSPPSALSDPRLQLVQVRGPENAAGVVLTGTLTLIGGKVADSFAPASTDASAVALSSIGAFDERLRPRGRSSITLTHYNYADQVKLLAPRAIAYSAGLINRFYDHAIVRNLFSAGSDSEQYRPGIISVLGGDLWRDDNPFQKLLLSSSAAAAAWEGQGSAASSARARPR